ncbi:hypothetical protein KIPB_003359 [Kipferlia bialata]|uniref:Uncharacterized protein n=1 Tax=Kipferlia bialata TaxID=797122 RepID=A0A9K3GH04_9EUKA|nr:hypothetical protein KIPB_003359 [Kipferlia bialata]|eukprot:g3359.t1
MAGDTMNLFKAMLSYLDTSVIKATRDSRQDLKEKHVISLCLLSTGNRYTETEVVDALCKRIRYEYGPKASVLAPFVRAYGQVVNEQYELYSRAIFVGDADTDSNDTDTSVNIVSRVHSLVGALSTLGSCLQVVVQADHECANVLNQEPLQGAIREVLALGARVFQTAVRKTISLSNLLPSILSVPSDEVQSVRDRLVPDLRRLLTQVPAYVAVVPVVRRLLGRTSVSASEWATADFERGIEGLVCLILGQSPGVAASLAPASASVSGPQSESGSPGEKESGPGSGEAVVDWEVPAASPQGTDPFAGEADPFQGSLLDFGDPAPNPPPPSSDVHSLVDF